MMEDAITKGELLELLKGLDDSDIVVVACQFNDEVGYFPIIDVTTEVADSAPEDICLVAKTGIAILVTDEEVK